jgi:hypothetical protein
MVANIGAGVRQLGKWISPSFGGISISKPPSPTQPALRTSPRSPVSLADRRPFLISNGLTKFILHWYVTELHLALFFPQCLTVSDGYAASRLVVVHRCSGSAILHMALLACKPESPTIHCSTLQVFFFHVKTGR